MQFEYLSSAERTDVGRKRKNNEDNLVRLPSHGVFCVADGMGGGDAGEVASAAIAKAVTEVLDHEIGPDRPARVRSKARVIKTALNQVSRWIHKRAEDVGRGMCGSTVAILIFDPFDPPHALTVHAGDSPVLRFRGGRLKQMTRDHSFAAEAGYRNEEDVPKQFRGVVTRAVGIKPEVKLEETPVDVLEDDLFVLCSDGLTKMVNERELLRLLRAHGQGPLDEMTRKLVEAANEAGGNDNITVVLVRVGKMVALPAELEPPEDRGAGAAAGEEKKPREEPAPEKATEEQGSPTEERKSAEEVSSMPAEPGPAAAKPSPPAGEAADSTREPPAAKPSPPPPKTRPQAHGTQPRAPARPAPRPARAARRVPAVAWVGLGVVAAALVLAVIVAPRVKVSRGRAAVQTMDLDLRPAETFPAYVKRLDGYRDEIETWRGRYPEEPAFGTKSAAVSRQRRALPDRIGKTFEAAIVAFDVETIRRLYDEWRILDSVIRRSGLPDAEVSRRLEYMEMWVRRAGMLEAMKRTVDAAGCDTAFADDADPHLDGFAAEPAGDMAFGAWTTNAQDMARTAASACLERMRADFDTALAARDPVRIGEALTQWRTLQARPRLAALVAEPLRERAAAVHEGVDRLAAGLRDEVAARYREGQRDAAAQAYDTLAALGAQARNFTSDPQLETLCAEALNAAGEAMRRVDESVSRSEALANRLARLREPDAEALGRIVADYRKLAEEADLTDEERKRIETAAAERCAEVARGAAAAARELYGALRVADADRKIEALAAFVAAVPESFGRAEAAASLDGIEDARARAEQAGAQRVAGVEAELAALAEGVRAADPAVWTAAVASLDRLAGERGTSPKADALWQAASAAFPEAVLAYVRLPGNREEREARVVAVEGVLALPGLPKAISADALNALRIACREERDVVGNEKFLADLTASSEIQDPTKWGDLLVAMAGFETSFSALPESVRGRLQPPWADAVGAWAQAMRAHAGSAGGARQGGGDPAAMNALLGTDEAERVLGAAVRDEILALARDRQQDRTLEATLVSGQWGGLSRTVEGGGGGKFLSDPGAKGVYDRWRAAWSEAASQLSVDKRNKIVAKYHGGMKVLCQELGVPAPKGLSPAVLRAEKDAWADAYCAMVFAGQKHLYGQMAAKASALGASLEFGAEDPAGALAALWWFVGEASEREPREVAERVLAARSGLDEIRSLAAAAPAMPVMPEDDAAQKPSRQLRKLANEAAWIWEAVSRRIAEVQDRIGPVRARGVPGIDGTLKIAEDSVASLSSASAGGADGEAAARDLGRLLAAMVELRARL